MATSFPTVNECKQEGQRAFERGKKFFDRSMDRAKDLTDEARERLEDVREEARHGLYQSRKSIQRNPLMAVGIGVAAGAMLGVTLGLALSPKMKTCCDEERFI